MKVVSSVDSNVVSIEEATRKFERNEGIIVVKWDSAYYNKSQYAVLTRYQPAPNSNSNNTHCLLDISRNTDAIHTASLSVRHLLDRVFSKEYTGAALYFFETFEDMIRELAKEI